MVETLVLVKRLYLPLQPRNFWKQNPSIRNSAFSDEQKDKNLLFLHSVLQTLTQTNHDESALVQSELLLEYFICAQSLVDSLAQI